MPRATALASRFAEHLRASRLLGPGERLLIGVSGGLDSVCLLHLLRFTVPHLGLELHAAHFDHALRPESADDAQWVRGLCRAWQVPFVSRRAALPPRGEAAARALRYGFLQQAAAECGAHRIVTAHQADDQLETILFRLARGTGLSGLRGIPERRGQIVRPLLPFRRAELLEYARRERLSRRDDASNRLLHISRNRIRHRVLPALEASWPEAASRLLELAALAAGLERLWQSLLPELLQEVVEHRSTGRLVLAAEVLREYHAQSRARVVRELARQLGTSLERRATRTALAFMEAGESGTSVRLGSGLKLSREFDRLTLARAAPVGERAPDLPVSIETAAAGRARARIGGTWFDVAWGPQPPAAPALASVSFDPSALRFPLELRGWRPGDRIRLRYGSKKLKKLFVERRIPQSRRAAVPVLAEQGEQRGVLWIAGVARAPDGPAGTEGWHITVDHGESA